MNKYGIMLLVLLASAIIGCGGGGGTGDGGLIAGHWMIVNVESNTEPATSNTYKGDMTTTPMLYGAASSSQTLLEMVQPDTVQIDICAQYTVPGTYQIDNGLMCTGVRYVLISNTTGTVIYGAESGTVTLTSVGAPGEPIVGSFDSIVTNNTDTKRVWGSFSINRVW